MARPLRIEGSDFWYHVMVRGDGGRALFDDRRAYEHFIALLARYCPLFNIEVHAYALMPNHVHLLLHTFDANLSRFMQRLTTAFSVWYNKRHERYGHVFQGRYKAIVVEQETYSEEVTRYIHLNPARVKCVSRRLNDMRRAARTYEWSSYRAYLGLSIAPPFLITAAVLSRFGVAPAQQRRAYATFVEEGLLKDLCELEEHVQAQSVLGSESFLERVRRMVSGARTHDDSARRNVQRLQSRPLQEVLMAVAECYGTKPAALVRRGHRNNEARMVALWAAARWCSTHMSLDAIGRAMGGISAGAVSHATRKAEKACAQRGSSVYKNMEILKCKFT